MIGRKIFRLGAALCCGLAALPHSATAGPPFITDDPEPTDTDHWEIYAPYMEGQGRGKIFSGTAGVEINYGAAPNVQLTMATPTAYSHDDAGWHWGAGDLEMSVKYRFYNDSEAGFSVAMFPGITLPTGTNGMSAGQITILLPLWAQKDFGPWSVFGGGGYAINPGAGSHDYWTGGLAVKRTFGERLELGVEATHSGADSPSTSLGMSAIYQCKAPFRILASVGPTFADAGGAAGFHGYMALGLNF